MKILLKNRQYVLSVSYGNYKISLGGTDKVIKEQKELFLEGGISFIHLYPVKKMGKYKLCDMWGMILDDDNVRLVYYEDIVRLLILLNENRYILSSVYIHHLLGVNLNELDCILNMVDSTATIYWYIHDYYLICPQYNLLKNDKCFCNKKKGSSCAGCKYADAQKKEEYFKRRLLKKYEKNSTIIAPSEVAKNIFANNFSQFGSRIVIIPHQKLEGEYDKMPTVKAKLKIAYLGSQNSNKGYDIWEKFVKHYSYQFDFYHFGNAVNRLSNVKYIEVTFQRDGIMAMTSALRENEINIVFLCSIWQETYSYTYYESWAANSFVITLEGSGNIEAMVKKNGNGIIFTNVVECLTCGNYLEKKYFEWITNQRKGPNRLLINCDWLNLSKRKGLVNSKETQKLKWIQRNPIKSFLWTKLYCGILKISKW